MSEKDEELHHTSKNSEKDDVYSPSNIIKSDSEACKIAEQVESVSVNERGINEFDSDFVHKSGVCEKIVQERFKIIKSVGEECIAEDELLKMLRSKTEFTAYDGFEPSGRMHIAQGILKAINVNKITSSGGIFILWVADWFALLNNKMSGNMERIKIVGEYMTEVWRAAGMDMTRVKFIWASEEINKRNDEYWSLVFDIATKNTLDRVRRCTQIMGRTDSDSLTAAQIFYPVMQCADIFFLKADICQLGMDQRKVNMLAREYCEQSKRRFKPIILSHKMIAGLAEGQEKMSKSDPSSAIYVEDSESDVSSKIRRAFCPPGILPGNPIIEYVRFFCFSSSDSVFEVARSEANGGPIRYNSYEEVCADFVSLKLHPSDLKPALARHLNDMIAPIRNHFATNPKAKALFERVKSFNVTR